MSGSQFLETLRQLGYPKADELDSLTFDWLFEVEEAVPFLTWFCANLSENNVVSPAEIDRFEILQNSGEVVLDGMHLQEALKTLVLAEEDASPVDDIKEQVVELGEDVETYKMRKQVLLHQRNKLNVHLATVRHRTAKFALAETNAKKQLRKSLDQCHSLNSQTMESLEGLRQCVGQVHSLYAEPGGREERPPLFLSQLPLEDYHHAEDAFSREVTAFTKKQFFQGIAEMAGQSEGSRYAILEVSRPETLLVQGERQEVVLEDCQELTRLKDGYPRSESERINALVSEKRVESALKQMDDITYRVQSGEFCADITALRQQLLERERGLGEVRRDIQTLVEGQLRGLLQKAGSLQTTRVLTGDYSLKLIRQDYFTSNQDQVIQQLVSQRARNEFLTMAYEVEARGHREMHRLLSALTLHLQELGASWNLRMDTMDNPAFSLSRHQRSTVDTRNKSTARLHEMLLEPGSEDRHRLFLAYGDLVSGAAHLQQSCQASTSRLQSALSSNNDKLSQLDRDLKVCEEAVYADSTTVGGLPEMTPRPVGEKLAELKSVLEKAEAAVTEVIKDINKKKKLLQGDPLLMRERNLYKYFFTNPDQLRREMDSLTAQIEAGKVK